MSSLVSTEKGAEDFIGIALNLYTSLGRIDISTTSRLSVHKHVRIAFSQHYFVILSTYFVHRLLTLYILSFLMFSFLVCLFHLQLFVATTEKYSWLLGTDLISCNLSKFTYEFNSFLLFSFPRIFSSQPIGARHFPCGGFDHEFSFFIGSIQVFCSVLS